MIAGNLKIMNILRIRYVPFFNVIILVVSVVTFVVKKNQELMQDIGEEKFNSLRSRFFYTATASFTFWCHVSAEHIFFVSSWETETLQFPFQVPKAQTL